MSGLTIRPATTSDFDAVDRIHAASVREFAAGHYDPDTIQDWSRTLDREVFNHAVTTTDYRVAMMGDEVAAFAQLDYDTGKFKMLYVHPHWAGNGVGGRLLSEMEAIARQRGLSRLVLRSSLNALRFYLHRGWREVERTTHVLRSGREVPCVLMERELEAREEGMVG